MRKFDIADKLDNNKESEYPIKEVLVQKIYTTTVFIRANSSEEAQKKVYELAEQGKLDDKFTDEPYYSTEKYNAYKEGYINEDVILNF